MGKFDELEAYGLVRSFHTSRESDAVDTLERIVSDPTADETWADRREAMLEEKIDVTEYVLSQLLTDVDEPTPGAPAQAERESESDADERGDPVPQ
ncbi:hypothetical protein C477_11277 [Haloterrigena salina JCM 13891]|uniref:Uncharacterized protein n=1 Tax=Haloterrigena salina JCM 13891 TaxID=1227488 RepID=M0C775_9EURY|nr:hypothetical protein C477_11277 [Haloterrigena salina JCM 13891]